ncbi:hypothetical protein [Paracoccus sp. (in: a-proteobacteria)]|uniref:hypothetical protein n=1 Tax=Paracoccus sp. TaxID=267 RepID=UPI00289AB060|nr:hypothetical protein [Paracoccus sp. (in: a-proteobacteria)]
MSTKSTSHKARVVERLLASLELIDASLACALLRIETDDPESTMQAIVRDDILIALVHNDRTMFPLFQFDVLNGRIFDVVGAILELRPTGFSNMRLAYWMTRAHVDLGGKPAERFGKDDAAILAAFRRDIEPECHG